MGYTPEEVMGKNLVQEFITDEFKMPVQAVLDQALHGEETANFGKYDLVEEVYQLRNIFLQCSIHPYSTASCPCCISYLIPYSHPLSLTSFLTEFPLMTKGGVRLDVLLNATTRRDEQGNVIGVVGTYLLFVICFFF